MRRAYHKSAHCNQELLPFRNVPIIQTCNNSNLNSTLFSWFHVQYLSIIESHNLGRKTNINILYKPYAFMMQAIEVGLCRIQSKANVFPIRWAIHKCFNSSYSQTLPTFSITYLLLDEWKRAICWLRQKVCKFRLPFVAGIYFGSITFGDDWSWIQCVIFNVRQIFHLLNCVQIIDWFCRQVFKMWRAHIYRPVKLQSISRFPQST